MWDPAPSLSTSLPDNPSRPGYQSPMEKWVEKAGVQSPSPGVPVQRERGLEWKYLVTQITRFD